MRKSSNPGMTRREILKATAAAVVASPLVLSSSVFGDEKKASPNERITIGHIGVGNQGGHLFRSLQGVKEAQSIAVSDCFKSRRDAYAEACSGKAFDDFRDILERDNVDCVVIATPDHWHVPIAIYAAQAGKSAYVEKPLGLSIEQNLLCEKVFKEKDVIFQYGTQQRSSYHCWYGCELVRQGVLGKITAIDVVAPDGHGGGSLERAAAPDDFDYEMWIGPAPMTPYTVDRCRPDGTYMIYDQSIGYLGGWGAHPLDIMVWGSDADLSGPVVVKGTGVFKPAELLNAVYNWDMQIALGEVKMTFKPGGDLTRFIGEKGSIDVTRGGIKASDPKILETKIDESKIKLARSDNHYADFISAVKSHKPAVSPLSDAVRSDVISHLCDIAVRTGEEITWDPGKSELVKPSEAVKKMMSREMRAPWTLEKMPPKT